MNLALLDNGAVRHHRPAPAIEHTGKIPLLSPQKLKRTVQATHWHDASAQDSHAQPSVQSLPRLLERARRLQEKGAGLHRLWKYVQQRWVYWLHGGVRGAVAEHRFTQIWNYANKILTGKSGRGPDCSVLNRMAHAVDEQCTERFKLVGFTPFSEDELTEDDLLVRPRSVRPTACFLPNAEAVEK